LIGDHLKCDGWEGKDAREKGFLRAAQTICLERGKTGLGCGEADVEKAAGGRL